MSNNSNTNQNNAGGRGNLREEQVQYYVDPEQPGTYIPRISVATTKASGKVEKSFRQFEASDMERVLDYEASTHGNLVEAPADGVLMIGEENDGNDDYTFLNRYCCLRGNFVFYFNTEDVDDKSGPYATYHAPPVGVIPLDNVEQQFPPGGRRVFREHAHTDARNGYEFVVFHDPPEMSDDEGGAGEVATEKKEVEEGVDGPGESGGGQEPAGPQSRNPFFIVASTLGERQQWADAIGSRSQFQGQATMLRASYSTSRSKGGAGAASQGVASVRQDGTQGDRRKTAKAGDKDKNNMFDSEDMEVTAAVNEFGIPLFSEVKWMDNFFENNNDYDAPDKCDQMEHWQQAIKKSLKAAVLEQYEYFVQASGEMTTMGKEVSSLKTLVETQMETIREMKEVDFSGFLQDYATDDKDLMTASKDDAAKKNGNKANRTKKALGLFDEESELSSVLDDLSSHQGGYGRLNQNQKQLDGNDNAEDPAHAIEVPAWLDDVGEEVSAFVKECRYTDAIDLWTKAKSEVSELFDKVRIDESAWSVRFHTRSQRLTSFSSSMKNQLSFGSPRRNKCSLELCNKHWKSLLIKWHID